MHSACVREMDENLKELLIETLEFIHWKKQVKSDFTVFIKPNFTFSYYKEGFTAMSLVTKEFGSLL